MMFVLDNTYVTLWLVTLVILPNHNDTTVQKTKKPCERKRRKVTCNIVVGQYHQYNRYHPSAIRLYYALQAHFTINDDT